MCEYKNKCWRNSYSRYYLQCEKYLIPPLRQVLFLKGFATLEMMPKKGLFCDNMPSLSCEKNLCPFVCGIPFWDCHEFKRETKRIDSLKIKKNKYENASIRQTIPCDIRKMIARNARYQCEYCGSVHNKIIDGQKIKCVIDHFIPLAQGGHPTDPCNLVFACSKCNSEKRTNFWQKGCKK